MNESLILIDNDNNLVKVIVLSSSFLEKNESLIEYCLTISITEGFYKKIKAQNLFNGKFKFDSNHPKKSFELNSEIQVEIILNSNLLSQLQSEVENPEEILSYLVKFNRSAPYHSLFLAEHWLAISFKQMQATGEVVGYETLWAKIRPQALAEAAESGSTEEISDAVTEFFQAWTESNLSHLSDVIQKATSQPFDGFTQFFDELADVAVDAVAKAVTKSDSLLEDVIAFLKNDNWPFEQIPDQSALRSMYRGQNGQWNCYTNIDETQRTIAFYSICPIAAPEEKQNGALGYPCRARIAEFITRANYGMVIGNFELDYSDGEIRYKTSVDVEGSVLNSALIKQLVYTNVLTMDQYLPGILAVMEDGVEPRVAVERVEGDGASKRIWAE